MAHEHAVEAGGRECRDFGQFIDRQLFHVAGVDDVEVRWSWALSGAIAFLVIGASILAVSALHLLMRRGQAARATSLVYLTPLFAVVPEWVMFGVTPTALSVIGIATTCAGVGLAVWRPQRGAGPMRVAAKLGR